MTARADSRRARRSRARTRRRCRGSARRRPRAPPAARRPSHSTAPRRTSGDARRGLLGWVHDAKRMRQRRVAPVAVGAHTAGRCVRLVGATAAPSVPSAQWPSRMSMRSPTPSGAPTRPPRARERARAHRGRGGASRPSARARGGGSGQRAAPVDRTAPGARRARRSGRAPSPLAPARCPIWAAHWSWCPKPGRERVHRGGERLLVPAGDAAPGARALLQARRPR